MRKNGIMVAALLLAASYVAWGVDLPLNGAGRDVAPATGCPEFVVERPRSHAGPVVRAADFGFSAASDRNAMAINRALARCREVKASRLELAPGTYRCYDEPGIVVRDLVDFTFDGKGAVLVFRRPPEYRCQPQSELILDKGNLLVQRCLRTEVRDLTMDWDWEGDPLASFVRVTRRNLDEAHPENAWMELTFVDYERHPKYPEPVPVQKLMAMDECRTRFRTGPGLSCGQTEGHFGAKNEWTAPNVLRVWPGIAMPGRNQNPATRFASNPKWNLQAVRRFAEGGLYRLQHCYYGKNGINLDSNRHLTVRDVRVWACFGMAMVTDGAQEYWQVERFRVAPPTAQEFAAAYPGKRFFERPVSSTSDGHHVARSKGHCKYIDCYWTRNNDDSSNFHDRFTIAVKVAPRKLHVINRRGAAYFRAEPGAPLELRHPDFSPVGCTAKLVRVNKELLELDRDIPDQKGPCFLVWDRTYGTDWVLFKGCTCEDSGWRNLFSPSNLTIEDCTFRRTPGVPLRLIADWRADLWCEGMGATNVVIRNCTFEDAGTLVPKEGQISTRCVVPEGWDIPPPDKGFVGGDVLIEKCTFVRPTGPVLDFPTGRNVTMRDCTVDLRGIRNATPSAGAFNTAGAENVRIERITTLRLDRSKLLIGAYCLQGNAKTEAHVKAIRDCGVDFIIGLPAKDRATLDLFAKHGVGAIVNGVVPGWWGGDGENAGKMREKNPPAKYAAGAAAFKDHPAIWAVDIGDEPSALDFPYYGEIVRQLGKALPGMPLYLNLYPNYASVAQNTGKQTVNQLGTKTYAEHVEVYCREVPLDYISYDFYPYMKAQAGTDRFLSKMYDNFLVVADACRRTKKSFWYIPQVNSRDGMSPTSENRLRFQANASLSFGAEAITWACWCKGWWTNNVLDAAGRQTEQYAKLQRVNAELKRLGPQYMRFRNVATRFVGFAADAPCKPSMPFACAPDDAGYPHASNGAALLVGEMVARDSASTARAYFVTAADDPCDAKPASYDLVFTFKEKKVTAFGGQGPIPVARRADGSCSVPITSCGGVLLVVD